MKFYLLILYVFFFGASTNNRTDIYLVCNETNDLFKLLIDNNYSCKRYDNISEALKETPSGEKLLVLAQQYPKIKTNLPDNFYTVAKTKNLKVFVEFPNRLPDGKTGGIKSTKKERLVVNSGFAGEALTQMSILDAGLYSYVEVADHDCYLTGAKVAGFKKAVYGLENTPNFPILFEDSDVLVSTTKLSDFNKSRYSPKASWEYVIKGILNILDVEVSSGFAGWESIVKPAFSKNELLTTNAYKKAVSQGAAWYEKGHFLIHPDWKAQWKAVDTLPLPVGLPIDLNLPSGDGSLGVMEGHYSYINPDGSQPYRYWLRADCVSETAMTFAIADNLSETGQQSKTAKNLMDFLFISDAFQTAESRNPHKSSYGLIGWADTHKKIYYGDDNARVIIGAVLTAQILGEKKWDDQIERLILANFRTAGKNGFRSNALSGDNIEKQGWKELAERQLKNPAPHYESWLWATYLWLYDKTNYKPLLDKAKKAIQITMGKYPDKWLWTNGIQQERARMILPLAWLVRVEDTKQHRKWLTRVCNDLLSHQVECGALREELGVGSNGKYGAPKNNQQYGMAEAPVIQANGEPVADMLYTSNFAFFALNEAARATNNPKYLKAVNKLAEFLVRIQSTSSGRADLDGCWFRAFDYENWEYYGSNADHGWGAWGTLTGWTQSFITTTLALKMQETSYWELTKETTIGDNFNETLEIMFPK